MEKRIKKGLLLSVAFVSVASIVNGQDNGGKMSGERKACISEGTKCMADTAACDKASGGQAFWALPQKRVGIKVKRSHVLADSCRQDSVLRLIEVVNKDSVVDAKRNFMEVARKRKSNK